MKLRPRLDLPALLCFCWCTLSQSSEWSVQATRGASAGWGWDDIPREFSRPRCKQWSGFSAVGWKPSVLWFSVLAVQFRSTWGFLRVQMPRPHPRQLIQTLSGQGLGIRFFKMLLRFRTMPCEINGLHLRERKKEENERKESQTKYESNISTVLLNVCLMMNVSPACDVKYVLSEGL